MIIKVYEIKKINLKKFNSYLIYGENEGLKNEIIQNNLSNNSSIITNKYDEKEILNNYDYIISNLLNKSFFENEKIVIIFRVTEKILRFINEFYDKKIDDVKIILCADKLEKKSKLRLFFEKNNYTACIPVYSDDNKTLRTITSNFFRDNNIKISSEIVNFISDKCNGDRGHLNKELSKIKIYFESNGSINIKEISALTNLSQNFSVSELIDNCLSKNRNRTIKILNENKYTPEDSILIIRTFLSKTKRVLDLRKSYEISKDIDQTINTYKPPIFWKDKEIVKMQISKWKAQNLEKLIIKINEIELMIKRGSTNSLNILYDFILGICIETNN